VTEEQSAAYRYSAPVSVDEKRRALVLNINTFVFLLIIGSGLDEQ